MEGDALDPHIPMTREIKKKTKTKPKKNKKTKKQENIYNKCYQSYT
jgi:hypothetical protein